MTTKMAQHLPRIENIHLEQEPNERISVAESDFSE